MNDNMGNNGAQLPLHLQLQQLLQQQNQLRTVSAEGHAGIPGVGSAADRSGAGGISARLTQQSNLMHPSHQSVGGVVGNHSEQMTQQLALQLSLLKQQLANSGPMPNDQSSSMAASGFVSHGNGGFADRAPPAPGAGGGLPSDPLLLQQLSSAVFQNQNLSGIPSNILTSMSHPRPSSPSPAGFFGREQQNHQQQGSSMTGSSFGVSDFMAPPEPNRLLTPVDGMRVPCRARGMPKSHNADTAYFVIPNDVQHGEGLRCSHYECQNKGIRFVYCKVCEVPVAKINFSTRHKHKEEQEGRSGASSKKRNKTSTPDTTTPPTSRNDCTNDSQKRRKRDPSQLGGDNVGTLQQTAVSSSGRNLNQSRTPQTTNELMVVNKSSGILLAGDKLDALGTVLGRKQEEWLSLLRGRPPLSNESGMVDWLRKVILVSQTAVDNTEQQLTNDPHSAPHSTKRDSARGINKLIVEGLKVVVDSSSTTHDESSSLEKGPQQAPAQGGDGQQEEQRTSQQQSSLTTTKQ